MPTGQLPNAGQIAGRRNTYPGLTLNRLQQHSHNIVGNRLTKGFKITVWNHDKTRGVRSEVIMCQRVIGAADDRRCAAMEVTTRDDDQSPAVGHAFDLVPPLPSDLDPGLDGLGASVH